MSRIREWIDTIVRISRDQAEYGEFHRKVQDRLFIFAIEIGRRKRLTPDERALYEKTLATAEVLLAITEKSVSNLAERIPYDPIMDDCVADWLAHEPALRRLLERVLGHSFAELDMPAGMWPGMRELIADQIRAVARVYPDELSESEVETILDRLEHPLDRA
jgi:hypothetical protein